MPSFDNRTTVFIGGEEYDVIASNGACVIYADQFRDKLQEPYTGRLRNDVLQAYLDWCKLTGDPVQGADEDAAQPESDEDAVQPESDERRRAITPDYEDIPQVLGMAWAMARAAGSTGLDYDAFRSKFMVSGTTVREFSRLFDDVIFGVAQNAFFRDLKRQEDAR